MEERNGKRRRTTKTRGEEWGEREIKRIAEALTLSPCSALILCGGLTVGCDRLARCSVDWEILQLMRLWEKNWRESTNQQCLEFRDWAGGVRGGKGGRLHVQIGPVNKTIQVTFCTLPRLSRSAVCIRPCQSRVGVWRASESNVIPS